jgi:hypothetical protein
MADSRREQELPPVYVIESIPVGGPHEVKPDEIASEKIPTPAHLRVYKEFGRGGMGHVHPATDRNLLRHVALKRLDKGLVTERFYVEGFIAEAQIAGQLEHPNIVPVHELAIDASGVPYFTGCASIPSARPSASLRASKSSSSSATPSATRTTAGSSIAISSRRTSWSATSVRFI